MTKVKKIIPKELELLAIEARKYKTAEEFVNGITLKVFSHRSLSQITKRFRELKHAYHNLIKYGAERELNIEQSITNFYNKVNK